LGEGDYFRDFVGPLGCPSEFVKEDIESLKGKDFICRWRCWCSSCLSSSKMDA